MITLALFIAHSMSGNPNFNPELLYLGTFFLDMAIIEGAVKVFGS